MHTAFSKLGKWPRRFLIGGAVMLGLLICVRLFAMSSIARGMVEARLEAVSVRGVSVEVDGLRGDLLGHFSIERITLHDSQGEWAHIQDAELSWSPSSLLFDHLNIRRIAAESVDFERQPEFAPQSESQASQNGFVNRYQVRAFDISDITLSKGVVGPAQSYALNGKVDTDDRAGMLSVHLAPLMGDGDSVQADLTWGRNRALNGKVLIEGQSHGLIAGFLQTPDAQSISARLEASGTLKDWEMAGTAVVGSEEVLDVTADHQNDTYTSNGRVTLTSLGLLQPLRNRVGDELTFKGSGEQDGKLKAELRSQALSGELSGQLVQDNDRVVIKSLSLFTERIDVSRLTGQRDLDISKVMATGNLELSSQEQVFIGDIELSSIRHGDYSTQRILSRGRHERNGNNLHIASQLEVAPIGGLPELLQEVIKADLEAAYDLAGGRVDVERLALQTPALEATANGRWDVSGALDFTGTLNTGGLQPFQRLATGWSLRGKHIDQLKLTLEGMGSLSSSVQSLQSLVGRQVEIDLGLSRDDSAWILERLSLEADKAQLHAAGAYREGAVQIRGRTESPQLDSNGLSIVALESGFMLTGPLSDLTLDIEGQSDRMEVAGQVLFNSQLDANLTLNGAQAFDVSLTGTLANAPADFAMEGALRRDILRLDNVSGKWQALSVTGAGDINLSMPEQSSFTANITGQTSTIRGLEGRAVYDTQTLEASAKIERASLGDVALKSGVATLNGTWPYFAGTLSYDGTLPILSEAQSLAGTHDFKLDTDTQTAEILGTVELAQNKITLVSPLQLASNPLLRAKAKLSAFEGVIDIQFDQSGTTASEVRITDLSMARLGPLIQRPTLRGRLDGAADIRLKDGQLEGQSSLVLQELSRGGPETLSATMRLSSTVKASQLTAELEAYDEKRALSVSASAVLGLVHDGDLFSIRPQVNEAIPVRLKGEGPIAPLWAIAAPPDLRLEGDINIDITNGAGTDFRFSGPMTLQDGTFEDGLTGFYLKDISLTSSLSPEGIVLDRARAKGGRSGDLFASGFYDFNGDGDVLLQLNRLNALNRSDIAATLSGRATLDRRNRRTHLAGDLQIDEARINLSKLPGSGYTTIDVSFRDELDEADTETPVREAISLDLGISADRRVFVLGPAIDSEWGMDVRVTGSPGQPHLAGRANLIRGEADLLSRRFRISEGAVRFLGAIDQTVINLRTERTDDGITSRIELFGDIMEPEVRLSSNPSLPQDEILARVLFGRSPSELSPFQAAQLAGAAAQLAGGDALNLTRQLEAATGLDRFDLGIDESGLATLSTGKYLADNIYLEIESSTSGAPGVALEWTPLDSVEVDAEIDPELGPKVAIQWKRDFDRLPGTGGSE